MTKVGFTLAEVMIVLTVIGVLTAILLPVAFQSTPNENVMKIKKAYNDFGSVIRELAGSDKYFKPGDMGYLPNGSAAGATYMCQAMADVMNVKKVVCKNHTKNDPGWSHSNNGITNQKTAFDSQCTSVTSESDIDFITTDGITYYQARSGLVFSSLRDTYNGFLAGYKTFCIDVDGVGTGEAPFGIGVRYDGKILSGARIDSWLLKSAQQN